MNAWGKSLHADKAAQVKFGKSPLRLDRSPVPQADPAESNVVADDSGAFASATGLVFDAQAFLGGPRAKRSLLIIVRPAPPPPHALAAKFPLTDACAGGRQGRARRRGGGRDQGDRDQCRECFGGALKGSPSGPAERVVDFAFPYV